MKRLFLSVLFILFTSLCFAGTLNVCLCPASTEIQAYLENTVKTVPFSEELSLLIAEVRTQRELVKLEEKLHKAYQSEDSSSISKALKDIETYKYEDDGQDFEIKVVSCTASYTEDRNVLKYLCYSNNCEILLFNEFRDLDSVSMRTVTVYNLLYDEITELSTVISSETETFTAQELDNIGSYFSYSPKYESEAVNEVIESQLSILSSVPSDVYIDGKAVGKTPYVLEKYTLPLLITLKAEGYRDQYVSISEETDKVDVILKPQWMGDLSLYKKASDRFYTSFGTMLLSIGLKAALNAVIPSDSSYYRITDTLSSGLIVIFAGSMIYNLIDYYNYANYNSNR